MGNGRICSGCFHNFPETARICPYCGFDPYGYEINRLPEALAPNTILRRTYLIGKVIGKGGFGITYIGYHLALGSVVAIKELFPQGIVIRNTKNNMTSANHSTVILTGSDTKASYEKTLRDFMREAKTVWEIDLPGVVKVTDCFEENGTAYMIMKYIAGKSLKEYLKSNGNSIPEREMLRRLHPMIRSLQQLHNKGIMHRDISPDNIMLGDDGALTLVDFGAARAMMSSMDIGGRSLTVVLKRGFAPLEQYNSRGNQGPWTDVYALCATMYNLLTGIRPDEPSARLENPSDKKIIIGNLRRNGVSDQTCFALLKGMELLARDRWQNMHELEQALFKSENKTVGSKKGTTTNFDITTAKSSRSMPKNKKRKKKGSIWIAIIMALIIASTVTAILINGYNKNKADLLIAKKKETETQRESIEVTEKETFDQRGAIEETESLYSLIVKNGMIQGTGYNHGSFREGEQITVEYEEKEGLEFTGWTVSDEKVEVHVLDNQLVFYMPAEEFTVEARYERDAREKKKDEILSLLEQSAGKEYGFIFESGDLGDNENQTSVIEPVNPDCTVDSAKLQDLFILSAMQADRETLNGGWRQPRYPSLSGEHGYPENKEYEEMLSDILERNPCDEQSQNLERDELLCRLGSNILCYESPYVSNLVYFEATDKSGCRECAIQYIRDFLKDEKYFGNAAFTNGDETTFFCGDYGSPTVPYQTSMLSCVRVMEKMNDERLWFKESKVKEYLSEPNASTIQNGFLIQEFMKKLGEDNLYWIEDIGVKSDSNAPYDYSVIMFSFDHKWYTIGMFLLDSHLTSDDADQLSDLFLSYIAGDDNWEEPFRDSLKETNTDESERKPRVIIRGSEGVKEILLQGASDGDRYSFKIGEEAYLDDYGYYSLNVSLEDGYAFDYIDIVNPYEAEALMTNQNYKGQSGSVNGYLNIDNYRTVIKIVTKNILEESTVSEEDLNQAEKFGTKLIVTGTEGVDELMIENADFTGSQYRLSVGDECYLDDEIMRLTITLKEGYSYDSVYIENELGTREFIPFSDYQSYKGKSGSIKGWLDLEGSGDVVIEVNCSYTK